ncbi:MAG TPA: enoyl-CoA hydratase/isomerase family protein [Kaistiaceae bacterium]|nr:enoyl-CoA hydratase/isomerase family protein [Kaistiaceae bacterium]
MAKTVLLEKIGDGVAIVTLDRPHRLNAIVPELLDDLVAALEAANADPDIRAVVLTGAGRAFCSGDDLKDFAEQVSDEAGTTAYVERIQDVTRAMVLGSTPVVGAIRGWAVGGGLEWVINCDFAVCAAGTRFFFPEVSWGLFVTGGVTDLLPRLVGLQKAREMILFGEKFTAEEARDWGLVHDVVADEDLMAKATALAKRIAALPPGPVRDLRRILARPQPLGLEAAMAEETAATVRGFLDPETAKRVAEFSKGG